MKKYKLFHIGMCVGDNGFTRALKDNVADYRELHCGEKDMNEKAIDIAWHFMPDIVFLQIQTPDVITLRTIKILKSLGCWVCNFTGDVRQPVPSWYLDLGPHIDCTFFTNEADANTLRDWNMPAAYLNIGFDPAIYTPAGSAAACPDIVFMANHYPDHFPLSRLREVAVMHLKGNFTDRFGLYGAGWPNFAADGNWMNSQQTEASYYRGCKIAINCSHFDLDRYSSDRILRIMGSGAFCLTKAFPGMAQDYTDGVHLKVWHSIDDLVELCEYYLNADEERKKIAAAGAALVHGRDTFDHMVKNLLRFYEY